MAGTGTYYNTVVLSNPATQNPFTVASGGLVSVTSGNAIFGTAGYPWTLFNRGTLVSSSGNGVDLTSGGLVVNGQSGSSSGFISGSRDGVAIYQVGGTVINFGTIAGGSQGIALTSTGANSVGNYGSIAGGLNLSGTARVINSGTITSTSGNTAVALRSGTLINSGVITSTAGGVSSSYGASSAIINTGTILASRYGVYLPTSGTLTNYGIISSASGVSGRSKSIVNYGTITGTSGVGAVLGSGATLVNGGRISGVGTAVSFGGGAELLVIKPGGTFIGGVSGFTTTGTIDLAGVSATSAVFVGTTLSGTLTVYNGVTAVESLTLLGRFANNFALASDGHGGTDITIRTAPSGNVLGGTYYNTVVLSNPATQNPFTVASGGLVSVTSGNAIFGTAGYPWTLFNRGTLVSSSGNGVDLTSGGLVVNGQSGSSSGFISGSRDGVAIYQVGGTVINFGTIAGGSQGIALTSTGANSVGNYGSIAGGLNLSGTARVINSGTITSTSGNTAVALRSGTLINSGVITSTAGGVSSSYGASSAIINTGTILASRYGVYLPTSGTLTNYGIISSASGVSGRSKSIVNYGTITGTSGVGAVLGSGATLVNGGRISGVGTAVSFGGGAELLVIKPGGTFIGGVSGFTTTGTIDLAGVSATSAVFVGTTLSGTLTVYNGVTAVESLTLLGRFANNFALASDGHGGTDITIRQPIGNVLGGTYGYTIVLSNPGITTVTSTGKIVAASGDGVVNAAGTAGSLINMGTVTAPASSSHGVYLGSGGFVTNVASGSTGGYIAGAAAGVMIGGGVGTVTNTGTIRGGSGVMIAAGSSATIGNSGTIAGTSGTAVSLGGGSNRLILAAGASFQGKADGGGGKSVVEVATSLGGLAGMGGTGAADTAAAAVYVNLGSVTNFSALQVDPGATTNTGGIVSFDTLVNQGQINLAAGDSLAVGTVAAAATGGTIDLKSGGIVHFTGAVAAGQTVLFRPPGGGLVLDHPEQFAGAMTEFAASDLIDLPLGKASFQQYAGGVLSLSYGGGTVMLHLATTVTTPQFLLTDDGHGGTDIAVSGTVCFCRGTRVLTARGEVAVEDLAVGERVVTLSGALKSIRWIGMGRDLVTRANRLARPIIVQRGALSDGVPHRDLYLTHGHALYIDGLLIPVEHLVNHRTIRWDESARVVEYYHIELEDHDVLLAEGAPAESYYDAGNRAFFQNARPGSPAGQARRTFAPVLNRGKIVERIWARLFDRASGRIATETTDDPDLHLVVDGVRLDPAAVEDGVFAFALQAAPIETLLLRSRCGVPSLLGQSRRDHRPLGVTIRQIVLHHAGIATCFDYDQPQLREGGCYPPEDGFSWTDGEFALPARFFIGLRGPLALLVCTEPRTGTRYPLRPALADAA